MTKDPDPQPRRISRDELFALVWQKPMSRLSVEFGISGNGLAKICDRLHIPYPPRGYWAKKGAGRPVQAHDLPPKPETVAGWVDIHPTTRIPDVRLVSADSLVVGGEEMAIPETLDNLHPAVAGWLQQHRREQREREMENKRKKRDPWSFVRPLLSDLTRRDSYRFRVTSAFLTAVESVGGKTVDAQINGKIKLLIADQEIACTIVEKMVRHLLRPEGEAATWSAYPEHHQSGLHSSGYLRITIDTYIEGRVYQWIEAEKAKAHVFLGEIINTIMAAGPILAEEKRKRDDSDRRYREAEDRRRELQRLKALDEARWTAFRTLAADWDESKRLRVLLDELNACLVAEGDAKVGDRLISEWIVWTRSRIDMLDPLKNGLSCFFESLASKAAPARW